MIHDKGWLNQMLLNKLFEEEIQDITFFMMLLKFNAFFFSNCLCFFQCGNLVEINVCVFLNGIHHRQALKRLAKVHLNSVISNLCCAQNFLCHIAVQIFCQIHHAVVIGVCLIQFHQSKFRVMSSVKSLVTEYTANLINLFHSADNQAFQI